MVEFEDACEYIGIEPEYLDEVQRRRVWHLMRAARLWLENAVHPWVSHDHPLAMEAELMAVGEMYESRVMTDDRLSKYAGGKVLASLNRMCGDILMQLRLVEWAAPCEGAACPLCGEPFPLMEVGRTAPAFCPACGGRIAPEEPPEGGDAADGEGDAGEDGGDGGL